MTSIPRPRVSKKSNLFTQHTYDLPHRVHCSAFYPISPRPSRSDKPANAPTVVVYGHDQGVTVIWTGFKPVIGPPNPPPEEGGKTLSRKRTATTDINNEDGADSGRRRRRRRDAEIEPDGDVRMLNDLPPPPPQPRTPAVPKQDPEDTTYTQTVHLGTAVYSLSFVPSTVIPPIPAFDTLEVEDQSSPLSTILLKTHLVIAVACSDKSVRLICVPLQPTTPETSQVLTLSGVSSHRTIPTTISMTLVPAIVPPVARGKSSSVQPNTVSASSTPAPQTPNYDFLIASASPDVSGLLLLWRISLSRSSPNSKITLNKPRGPRSHSLSSPALQVSFNPSSSSTLSRHHLLLADNSGSLRILDTEKSRWLLSLYTDFPSTYLHPQPTRKRILAAQWCLDGSGIAVLDEDAEWGVFDLAEGRGKYLACGSVGEKLDSSSALLRRFNGTEASDTASSSTGGGGAGPGSRIGRLGSGMGSVAARSVTSVGTGFTSATRNNLHRKLQQQHREVVKGFMAVTTRSTTNHAVTMNPNEILLLTYANQCLLVPSIYEVVSAKKSGDAEKSRKAYLRDVVLGGEDVKSVGVRWVVGKPTPGDDGLGEAGDDDDIIEDGDDDDDEDDYTLDGSNSDGRRSRARNRGPGGGGAAATSKDGKGWVRVVIGAGPRLNVLDVAGLDEAGWGLSPNTGTVSTVSNGISSLVGGFGSSVMLHSAMDSSRSWFSGGGGAGGSLGGGSGSYAASISSTGKRKGVY
ncbi:hypothetical protein DFH27DRAFT_570608 [Peziza echinospora]|nr:hypothetical protein DFH27DRAFT_570608 [Peziza echinospora]